MKYYLLTAFGKDRVGIVRDVSEILYKFKLNIDDSSMIRLNNEFTIMLVLEDKENINLEELEENLKKIEERGSLNIVIKEIDKIEFIDDNNNNIYNIIAYGNDKIGIIYKISKFLADNNINIINLFTEKQKFLYVVIIKVQIPQNFNIQDFQKKIKELGQELDFEITVNEEIREVEM